MIIARDIIINKKIIMQADPAQSPPKTAEVKEEGSPLQQVWEDCDAGVWRDVVYVEEKAAPCMFQLFSDEIALFKEIHAELKKSHEKIAIIESGMGTAELFSKVLDDYEILVGVEISHKMIEYAYQFHQNLNAAKDGKLKLVQGDAAKLSQEIVDKCYPRDHEFWQKETFRLTCMCMNTFGILPPEIQGASLKEMMLVTGPGGKMIVGCWWRGAMESMGWPQLY